ncbi:hypothetical protein HOLleu_24041 [Holothuria leucospilota]|uniref:Uncharacterized protein n=1 Tax=Holothuria leucospilota TaxID=206669 RepID=A0A9Q1BUW9_HOLLE|nr:hypothetical protein HOLleu_24041 [Holothuria leucospilota]
MHSTTKDKQIDSITEEVKQIDSSVFGMTSERTENRTEYTVVAGKVTTTDETFASTQSNGNGISVVSNNKTYTQRTIKDDRATKIYFEETESTTNGLSTSGRESSCQSFHSEDLYQSETFTRCTNRDGSSTWRVTEITLRLKDKYYLVKHVYSPENGDDVIGDDELHRYLQC